MPGLRLRGAGLVGALALVLAQPARAADCELSPVSGRSGLEVLGDWRVLAAPLLGFAAGTLVLFALAAWRGRRRGHGAVVRSMTDSPRLWLLVYAVLLAALIPASYAGLARVEPGSALRIDIVCYPALRLYRYDGAGPAFYNRDWPARLDQLPDTPPDGSRPLVVPVGQVVELRVNNFYTDRPWWRSVLGLARAALPRVGESLRLRFTAPGEYRGFCRSQCPGVSAESPLIVRAMEQVDLRPWMQGAAVEAPPGWADAGLQRLMRDGERVYRRRCAACHGEQGQGGGGLFPGLRGSPMLRGPLENHVLFVWYGRPGSPMKAFGDELDLYQMAAVTTYQRNAWGVGTGDRVQAADVQAVISAGAYPR